MYVPVVGALGVILITTKEPFEGNRTSAMLELCKSLHFLPGRPPLYESSLKKTEFLEDVARQEYNFKWRVMLRFLCKPIVFLTLPLKTRDSLVPQRRLQCARERELTKPSTIFLVHCTQVEVFFPPSVFQNKQTKHESKHTNKSTATTKCDRRSMWNRIVSVWFGIGKTLVCLWR